MFSKPDDVAQHGSGRTGDDSPALRRLGRWVLDHKGAVITFWIAAAVVVTFLLPSLETVARDQATDPIPADVPSFQSLDAMGEAFDEPGASATVFAVLTNPGGFDAGRPDHDRLVDRLADMDEHVRSIRDLAGDPITAAEAVSEDGQTWYLPLGLTGRFGSPETADAVAAVRDAAAQTLTGSDTTMHLTGPAATFTDQVDTIQSELLVISAATLALIGAILLIVYRSPVTAALPLLVIGAGLLVARGVLAGLGLLGLPVSEYSIAFLTAILLAAGTDYSVFVIARYHERIRAGDTSDQALVSATASIGRVIVASALTVALALTVMVFADLSVFATVGPACALAVLIALAAAMTLQQPVLAVAARRGRGLPGRDLTARHWRRVGAVVVRRPRIMLAASLAVLVIAALPMAGMAVSFDDRTGQPDHTDSNRGYALLDEHFPKDITISEFVMVSADHDLRTATGLADLDQMAARLAQLPGVTRVVGVTRPTGERLEQATLSWQNDQIGTELAVAASEGEARTPDLEQLRAGSAMLADALAQLHARIDTEFAPLADTVDAAAESAGKLAAYRPWLESLTAAAPGIDTVAQSAPDVSAAVDRVREVLTDIAPTTALLEAESCTQNPLCAQARDHLRAVTDLADSGALDEMTAISSALDTPGTSITAMTAELDEAVTALGDGLETVDELDVAGKIDMLRDGIGRLADGAAQLAAGVDALVDETTTTIAGMGQVAALLRASAAETTGSESAGGFYLPPDAFDDQDFSTVARQFVSPDGRSVRYLVQTDVDPYSQEAIELSNRIAETTGDSLPNTELDGATVDVAGFPAINADLQRLLGGDFLLLAVATTVIVGVILVALLRSLIAPLYLVATVLLNYVAALGIGVAVFQYGLGQALFWPVPLLAFIILVAVGADYNMLLVARLRAESAAGLRVGVLRTVGHTGAVITSAGIIFAASMFGLMAGSVGIMVQSGFIIGLGLLIDTFVVRTLTVPAIAALLGRANWWPGALSRAR